MKLIIPRNTNGGIAISKQPAKKAAFSLYGTGITKAGTAKAIRVGEKQHEADLINLQSASEKAKELEASTQKELQDRLAALDGNIDVQLVDENLVLDDDQEMAIEGLRNEMHCCIIGSAGVGKTTVLKAGAAELIPNLPTMYNPWDEDDPRSHPAIVFCSFMGKGTQQMKKALPKELHVLTNTVHKTIGYTVEWIEYVNEAGEPKKKPHYYPRYDETNKLPAKVCVIDESGSLGNPLYNELFAALTDDCRIIMLGDINQLPPVQGHGVLGFAMAVLPTFALTHIHRQAADNKIITNAHRILAGQMPTTDLQNHQVVVKSFDVGSTEMYKKFIAIIKHLYKQGTFDPLQDAIIVPQNVSILGQVNLNEALLPFFNPATGNAIDEYGNVKQHRIIVHSGNERHSFAIGDKLMLNKNFNDRGLTNGMIGVITAITPNKNFSGGSDLQAQQAAMHKVSAADFASALDEAESFMLQTSKGGFAEEEEKEKKQNQASHIITIKFQFFDGADVQFSAAGEINELAHAYAFTCHKSQGSEFRNVVILIHSCNKRMLNREWFYTAFTRAKERQIVICNPQGLKLAVKNQLISGNTMEEKMEKFIKLAHGDKDVRVLPNLPTPQRLVHLQANLQANNAGEVRSTAPAQPLQTYPTTNPQKQVRITL